MVKYDVCAYGTTPTSYNKHEITLTLHLLMMVIIIIIIIVKLLLVSLCSRLQWANRADYIAYNVV